MKVYEETRKGHTITIEQDECPSSPRDWDNLGQMVCFHRNDLGDGHSYSPDMIDDPENWVSELEGLIEKDEGPCEFLPLYLLDHSGLCISTGPFACDPGGWDSGVVGVIFISHEKMQEEYGEVTEDLKKRVCGYLAGEVETYSCFLNGETYGYVIEDADERSIESVWGYYGYESANWDYMLDCARNRVDSEFRNSFMGRAFMINSTKMIYHVVMEDEEHFWALNFYHQIVEGPFHKELWTPENSTDSEGILNYTILN